MGPDTYMLCDGRTVTVPLSPEWLAAIEAHMADQAFADADLGRWATRVCDYARLLLLHVKATEDPS